MWRQAGAAHADLELLAGGGPQSRQLQIAVLLLKMPGSCLSCANATAQERCKKVKYEECDTIDTARSQERYSNALAGS